MALAFACTLAPSAGAAAGCAGAALRPTARDQAAVDHAVLCLIDQIRRAHGLRALHANRQLGTVAGSQVDAMVRMDYFSDVRPTGQTPLALVARTPYAHSASLAVGQDIAWGVGGGAGPAAIVAAWMASPPHRLVILTGEYTDAGVAVTPSVPAVLGVGRRGATYAMEFARRGR